ncbi:hypothetical protein AaE_006866 [Aphanomyces astaci]|uniref:Kinase n=1 Tax=Aphanomyces astaci TaxID=112090 RepID=A0A6A5AJR8_APHAT|nr:hypothetical protein AaE_006866 [Aphanomyces astaci]
MADVTTTAAAAPISKLRTSLSTSSDNLEALSPNAPSLTSRVIARSSVGTEFYLYKHQVGGHKPLLRSAPGEVCKPALPLELQFYQGLASTYPQLIPFVPTYLGTIVVDLHPSSNGSDNVADRTNSDSVASTKSSSTSNATRRPSRSMDHRGVSLILWNKEIVRDQASFLCEYLVLGDLTQGYMRPCVLDIKMGTRQHGADASPAKARSHSVKCAKTTSATLGFRLCGMQIYQPADGRYVLRDKHWGRLLQPEDIPPALRFFLSTGDALRIDAVEQLASRLRELQAVIERTTGIRFWGASLLLVYEGDLAVPSTTVRTDVRLIDFANCHHDPSLVTPDDGLLLGLDNLIAHLDQINADAA